MTFAEMYDFGAVLICQITEARAEGRDYSEDVVLLRELNSLVQDRLENWQPHHRPN